MTISPISPDHTCAAPGARALYGVLHRREGLNLDGGLVHGVTKAAGAQARFKGSDFAQTDIASTRAA